MKQKYSPMMMQYLGIKEQNKDSIVMFRLGDLNITIESLLL